MALSEDQLATLRLMIDEPTQTPWDDATLLALAEPPAADGTYDLRATAASIWEMKAAKYVKLTSMSESGSSRSLGEIFAHAKQMADYFKKPVTDAEVPSTTFPRSTRIVRPTRGA